jgi:hypothetical protein
VSQENIEVFHGDVPAQNVWGGCVGKGGMPIMEGLGAKHRVELREGGEVDHGDGRVKRPAALAEIADIPAALALAVFSHPGEGGEHGFGAPFQAIRATLLFRHGRHRVEAFDLGEMIGGRCVVPPGPKAKGRWGAAARAEDGPIPANQESAGVIQ